jgi:hypothetical protein
MAKRVLLAARDLLFRSKLQALVQAAGAEVTREEPCDLAVVELGGMGVADTIRDLVARGVPVLAFGSHVKADELRAARALGARAVPNSEVATALRALL